MAQANHSVTATYHLPVFDLRISRQFFRDAASFSSLHAIAIR